MTAVYRLYDKDRRLIYVGIAEDFDLRFKQHRKAKAWWLDVASKDVIWFQTRLDACYEEARAIAAESPRENDHPGLDPVGLIPIRGFTRLGNQDIPAQSIVVVSKYECLKVVEDVAANLAHAAVAVEGVVKAVVVPAIWYQKACAALGELTDL